MRNHWSTEAFRERHELSGLPFSLIIAATKCGVLPAVKLGAGWRIKRSDLEQWADSSRAEQRDSFLRA
jgi:excisionase family DNA binding protein